MATVGGAQLQRQRTTVQEEVTVQQSTTLVKNLVRTAISSIAYLRNLFPDDCFQDKKLTGLTIRTLLPTRPESQLLINWLEQGVFDALDKHYLSDVVFAVYAKGEDRNTLLECYQFHVEYPETSDGVCAGPSMTLTHTADGGSSTAQVTSKDEIRDSTVRLIRTLVTLAQTLKALPRHRFVTVKLQYREGVTPEDYEPRYFRPGDEGDALVFDQRPFKVRVGEVRTKYHEVSVKMKSVADSFVEPAAAAMPTATAAAALAAGAAMTDTAAPPPATAATATGRASAGAVAIEPEPVAVDFRSPSQLSQASAASSRAHTASPLFRRGRDDDSDDDATHLEGAHTHAHASARGVGAGVGAGQRRRSSSSSSSSSTSLTGFVRQPKRAPTGTRTTDADAGAGAPDRASTAAQSERLAAELQQRLSLRSAGRAKRPLRDADADADTDATSGKHQLEHQHQQEQHATKRGRTAAYAGGTSTGSLNDAGRGGNCTGAHDSSCDTDADADAEAAGAGAGDAPFILTLGQPTRERTAETRAPAAGSAAPSAAAATAGTAERTAGAGPGSSYFSLPSHAHADAADNDGGSGSGGVGSGESCAVTADEAHVFDEFCAYVLGTGETNKSALIRRFGRARRGDGKLSAAAVRRFLSAMAARGLIDTVRRADTAATAGALAPAAAAANADENEGATGGNGVSHRARPPATGAAAASATASVSPRVRSTATGARLGERGDAYSFAEHSRGYHVSSPGAVSVLTSVSSLSAASGASARSAASGVGKGGKRGRGAMATVLSSVSSSGPSDVAAGAGAGAGVGAGVGAGTGTAGARSLLFAGPGTAASAAAATAGGLAGSVRREPLATAATAGTRSQPLTTGSMSSSSSSSSAGGVKRPLERSSHLQLLGTAPLAAGACAAASGELIDDDNNGYNDGTSVYAVRVDAGAVKPAVKRSCKSSMSVDPDAREKTVGLTSSTASAGGAARPTSLLFSGTGPVRGGPAGAGAGSKPHASLSSVWNQQQQDDEEVENWAPAATAAVTTAPAAKLALAVSSAAPRKRGGSTASGSINSGATSVLLGGTGAVKAGGSKAPSSLLLRTLSTANDAFAFGGVLG